MIEIILLLFLFFLSSSVAVGIAYWKRRDLLGRDVDASCETDDNCKTNLVCDSTTFTCREPNTCKTDFDCPGLMMCDDTVFECTYASVTAADGTGTDCVGYWDTPACPAECGQSATTVTQSYHVTTEKQGDGKACEAADQATREHACPATDPCPVDCVGEWETQPCTVACGENPKDLVQKYRVRVPRVGSGQACPHEDGAERRTPQGCQPPTQGCNNLPAQCVGEYETKTCPTNRTCNQPSYTIQRNYVVTSEGITCPNRGTTLPLVCPATATCLSGSSSRASALRGKALYHNTNKKVQVIRYHKNKKQCLSVGGNDDRIGKNDTVGFRDCDTLPHKDKLASWRLKEDGRIETWHASHNHIVRDVPQPLCLDFNNKSSDMSQNKALKVTECKDADLSQLSDTDQKNRKWNIIDHPTMTWDAQKDLITNDATFEPWKTIAPVRVQSQHRNDSGNMCLGSNHLAFCNRDDAQLYLAEAS